jgi:Rod binding domain-containing protein
MAKIEDVKQASTALEAYFLRRVLGEVRSSDQGLSGGGFAGGMFKEMFDEAIADKMAQAGGVGMAGVIQRQLAPGSEKESAKAPAKAAAAPAKAPAVPPAPIPRTVHVPEPLPTPAPPPIEGGSVSIRRYQEQPSSFPDAGRPTDRR